MLLKRIDELSLLAYRYLQQGDEIYYLGEYTAGRNASHSEINQLILNYKKDPQRQNEPDWIYKERAIRKAAKLFKDSIFQTEDLSIRVSKTILVPNPPSAIKDSPAYDNRNLIMLKYFMPNGNIQELLEQIESRLPLHESKNRSAKALEKNYVINTKCTLSSANEIWLFDDILTEGTHFRAADNIIKKQNPNVKVVGFFIARSVYPFLSQ